MPLQAAHPPPRPLHRIGHPPDPLAWPRLGVRRGINRFDDPLGKFSVLYAGESRRVCFLETLAPIRPRLALLGELRRIRTASAGLDAPPVASIPSAFLGRMIASFELASGQRWLDFRSGETFQALREEHPDLILGLGYEDFDASHALSADRDLTQAVARVALEAGYHGIVYRSRLDPMHDCWALFDRATIHPVKFRAITPDDPDLVAVARLFGLRIGP